MSRDRMMQIAVELMKLGVSQSGVERLLGTNDLDEVERQLSYLPYRKAKRPEAFIIEAVRRRYSAPKEFFYAANQAQPSGAGNALDEGSKHAPRSVAAKLQRHGTADHSDSP